MVDRTQQLGKPPQTMATTKMWKKPKPKQGRLPIRKNGGRRAGADRKPKGDQAMVSHAPRFGAAATARASA